MRRSPARDAAGPRAVAAFVILALLGPPAVAAEPVPRAGPRVRAEAQGHLDRGLDLYRAKSFPAAAKEFEVTYQLDPNRDVLYVWAQALRLAGDCPAAVRLYERFLAAGPPAPEAELARTNLARCQSVSAPPPGTPSASAGPTERPNPTPPLAVPPAPASAPPGVVAPLTPAETTRDFSPRGRLMNRVLLGGGVASAALGSAFYISARSERNAAEQAMTYAEVEQHADSARFRQRLAWGAVAVGATLIVAGVVHYLLR